MELKGSATEQNLKDAFAGESQANRRYLYFASKADVEGYNDVAAVFRSTAEGETGHAHGHLEYLEEVGDPATGLPMGDTKKNLEASIAGETHEYTDMYPGMAKSARDEGFDEIANPTHDFNTFRKAMDEHLIETCTNAKAAGITIYSIAFDVPNGSSVKSMLETCASNDLGGTKLYYDAGNNAELVATFQRIAEKLAELAITR